MPQPTPLAYKLAGDYVALLGEKPALALAEKEAKDAARKDARPLWAEVAQAIRYLDRRPVIQGSRV